MHSQRLLALLFPADHHLCFWLFSLNKGKFQGVACDMPFCLNASLLCFPLYSCVFFLSFFLNYDKNVTSVVAGAVGTVAWSWSPWHKVSTMSRYSSCPRSLFFVCACLIHSSIISFSLFTGLERRPIVASITIVRVKTFTAGSTNPLTRLGLELLRLRKGRSNAFKRQTFP